LQITFAANTATAQSHLLQNHQQDLGLHCVHAAADSLHTYLAQGKGEKQDEASRELGRLGALQEEQQAIAQRVASRAVRKVTYTGGTPSLRPVRALLQLLVGAPVRWAMPLWS
jgi:hypothetical protein